MRAAALVVLLAGCATFEDPVIVLDLRVLGMQADPPEILIDVPDGQVPTLDQLIDQLSQHPIIVRALVAEPQRPTELAWWMTACILDRGGRCEEDKPTIEFASGKLEDPEGQGSVGTRCPQSFDEPAGVVCGRLVPDNVLAQLLVQELMDDPAHGLGGIDVGISLRIVGATGTFAEKVVRVAPRIPVERTPNHNPHIDQLLIGEAGTGFEARKRHCGDLGVSPDRVIAGETITLFPVARDGDREEFVLPTLDGGSEQFVEYLSYQWIATSGGFSDEVTGGPPDVFGNVRLDGTLWTAPEKISGPTLATIWVLQRDARYGANWSEACIEVIPP